MGSAPAVTTCTRHYAPPHARPLHAWNPQAVRHLRAFPAHSAQHSNHPTPVRLFSAGGGAARAMRRAASLLLAALVASTMKRSAQQPPQCDQMRCSSPDGQGGFDCWATMVLNERCNCLSGHPHLTGRTFNYEFNTDVFTFVEYQCCDEPGSVRPDTCGLQPPQCDQLRCTSPDVEGGFDCWATMALDEPCSCASGYPHLTGQTFKYDPFGTFVEYQCCDEPGSVQPNTCGLEPAVEEDGEGWTYTRNVTCSADTPAATPGVYGDAMHGAAAFAHLVAVRAPSGCRCVDVCVESTLLCV
jgi:hypothetical protein